MTRRIRAFVPADRPALQAIREVAFASLRALVGEKIAVLVFASAEAEQARLLDELCAAGSGYQVLVVEEAGTIVGFVTFTIDVTGRIGEIGLNAVHPRHAGRGLGTWMYEQVLERMKDQGAAVATVATGGDPSHAPARRAYAKAGFGSSVRCRPSTSTSCSKRLLRTSAA